MQRLQTDNFLIDKELGIFLRESDEQKNFLKKQKKRTYNNCKIYTTYMNKLISLKFDIGGVWASKGGKVMSVYKIIVNGWLSSI